MPKNQTREGELPPPTYNWLWQNIMVLENQVRDKNGDYQQAAADLKHLNIILNAVSCGKP